ncbi:hypothetical protein L226DRAFT_540174 [Lentinus tigrinus ALCF2SS1-7]|uniref:Family A G protein-coupled receptor-like protein n=1 Tax=Lentinus tigrinus ALCF2SS1-6 TaxID=1328759 RepID=A0A5C2S2S1_9APHY|nr:hypothetical protein L227DRAFT_551334 [Lentinus tigrinus ALCF2SS1-6]RPD69004.1 hypothetical protein L226DRAFT_540174 [Lentinus tigrinus ALCF2SS1-7]
MSNSTGLSAATTARLRKDLTALAHNRVFPVVVETALYAIFTVLIIASTYLICRRGVRRSWPNAIMLAATLSMYALSTLDWVIDIRLLWNDLRTLMFFGLPGRTEPFGLSSPALLTVQGITSVICIIIGDAVVCWRVCVVWADSRAAVLGALFWVIGSIGVFTAWSVMFVGFYYPVPPPVQTLVDHSVIMNAFAFSWSAATNVWATVMIARKAWLQRRDIRRHLHTNSTGSAVQRILMFLVDLGIIYTAFMLLNVIVLIPVLNSGTVFFYVTLFMQQITGMYPTAVIVLVALQKSQLDHQFTYPPAMDSDEHSLPFTVNVPHGATSTDFDKQAYSSDAQIVALRDVDVKRSQNSGSSSGRGEYGSQWEKETQQSEGVGLAS